MSDFSSNAISAFLAVGKRYSVDIKLHGTGISQVLVQIETSCEESFIREWVTASADIYSCVNAWFGLDTLQKRPATMLLGSVPVNNPYGVVPGAGYAVLVQADKEALDSLAYALDVQRHEQMAETLSAIARFVRLVNR